MEENKDIFDHLKKRVIETPSKEYFDTMVNNILEEKAQPKVISIKRKVVVWITSAAAVLLVAFLLIDRSPNQSANILAELDNISTDELLAYMDEHIDEFETDLIAESLTEDQISELDEEITSELSQITYLETKKDIQFEDISPTELDEYLELEDIDLDDLENDFI